MTCRPVTVVDRPRLWRGADGRIAHDIGRDRLSNDLAGWIADDLVAPGLVAPSAFEETFVGVVTAVDPDWTAFYRNTLTALAAGGRPGGTVAETAPVHTRAVALAVGPDVVELGCCFGFLSLALARAGHRVTALDVVPGTAALLGRVAPLLLGAAPSATTLRAVAADATAVPLADGAADTVFAVHLLEHLPRGRAETVVREAVRVARRRVVVAVPYEDEPNAVWGHVRTVDAADLAALGAACAPGWTRRVVDHHGGWLVLDAADR